MSGDQGRSLFDALRSLLGEPKAREVAQELYGLGYYILPRKGDPFDLAKAPSGMTYQWILAGEAEGAETRGWKAVPHSRYEGMYAPIGYPGEIAHKGLVLMERDAALTEAAREAEIAKAHKNVDDWIRKWGGAFSGHIKIGASESVLGDPALAEQMRPEPPRLTRLSSMTDPDAMFAERERLRELAAECGDMMPTPAEITATAVANVKEIAR